MREFYPILILGAIIGTLSLLFIVAYATMKNKKEAIGFDRNMKDSEIVRRLLTYAKPHWKSFLFVGIVLLSWDGWISIFVLLAKVISTVSLGINNTKIIRILNLFSTPCWLMYNIFVGSIAGMCSDVLMITSIIIGIIRVDIIGARREKALAAAALASQEIEEQKETEV